MEKEQALAYVRAVWPAAQGRFNELLSDSGLTPEAAAHAALGEVEGLSWSHQEALAACGHAN